MRRIGVVALLALLAIGLAVEARAQGYNDGGYRRLVWSESIRNCGGAHGRAYMRTAPSKCDIRTCAVGDDRYHECLEYRERHAKRVAATKHSDRESERGQRRFVDHLLAWRRELGDASRRRLRHRQFGYDRAAGLLSLERNGGAGGDAGEYRRAGGI
jgi:hypothetical protein